MPSILKVAKNVGQTNVLNILRDVEMQLDGGPVRRGPRPSPRLYIQGGNINASDAPPASIERKISEPQVI
jgi:hypothetical protein